MSRRLALAALVVALLVAPHPVRAQDGAALPPSARITGLRHEYQTWCNCGPVNLTMVLSYYGWPHDQQTAAAWLKPTVEDKNVSPWELAAYVAQQSALPELRALWRYGGDLPTLKALIAAGLPVIVESGFQPPDHEWMGHYITLVAYDDAIATVWSYDSYTGYGAGYGEETGYAQFDAWWRHFNRAFIVVYPADRESEVRRILGPLADPAAAHQIAYHTARAESAQSPGDAWAHFNAGTSAVALGDYAAAARHYDRAFEIGLPFRMLWYQFGPYAAYYYTGRYFDLLALANAVDALTTEIEETMVWRGLAYAALGRPEAALAQMQRALAWNPNSAFARTHYETISSGAFVAPAPPVIPAVRIP